MARENASDALIRDYVLEMRESKCRPGENAWSAVLSLAQDVSEALPYANRVFDGDFYDHAVHTLTFRVGERHYAVRPRELCIAPVENRADAENAARDIVARLNVVWKDRDLIEPRFEGKTKPDLIALYRNLPRTNCGRCGRPSCMAFAAALREGKARIHECAPLDGPDFAEPMAKLVALLPDE